MDISVHPCLYCGYHKSMLVCTVVTTRVCLFVQWSPQEYACLYSGHHKSMLVCTVDTTRICLFVQWSPQEYSCLYSGYHKSMLVCTVVTTRICSVFGIELTKSVVLKFQHFLFRIHCQISQQMKCSGD